MNDPDMSLDASRSPLHFARFEFKYVLSTFKRQSIEADLRYFLDYDPFVAGRSEHRYFVRSLYYDDSSYTAFHDKIDGLYSRYKFRIRTYSQSQESDSPIFLEIKGRHNNLVYKYRTPVEKSDTDWRTLKGDYLSDRLLNRTDKNDVRNRFEYDLYRKALKPVALIDYQRRPYVSKYDPSFRITFDEELYASRANGLFPGSKSQPKRLIPGYTVIEVKFSHHLPSWFHRVIQTHELQRVSISKIVTGMEALGLAYDEH
jgi:hypothetical protein